MSLENTFSLPEIRLSKVLTFLVKVVIAVVLCYIIYRQLHGKTNVSDVWAAFRAAGSTWGFLCLLGAVLLVGVNWGLESLKWQRLIYPLERLSFAGSFKSVLCGVTVSMLTPNRTGEYAGRILTLQNEGRVKAIPLALAGSYAQLIANLTLGFSGLSLFCFGYYGLSYFYTIIGLSVALLLMGGALFLYYRLNNLPRLFRGKYLEKVAQFTAPLKQTGVRTLSILLIWSMLRYLVYTFQYFLLLLAFGIPIGWMEAWILISSIFFVQTFVPSVALAELGVRGNLALYFIGFTGSASAAILSAAFSLWMLNLIIPSIFGLVFITQSGNFKFFFRPKQVGELATANVSGTN